MLYGRVSRTISATRYSPSEIRQLREILNLLKRARRTVRLAHRLVASEKRSGRPMPSRYCVRNGRWSS